MAMVERSLPTFLRRKEIKLGGWPADGGIVVRRRTCSAGSGKSDFGFEGYGEARPVTGEGWKWSSASLAESVSLSSGSSRSGVGSASLSLSILMIPSPAKPSSASKNSCDLTDSRLSRRGASTDRLCRLSAINAENCATTASRSRRTSIHRSCTTCSS